MYNKKTNELVKKLESVHPGQIEDFISDNEDELMTGNRDFMEYMNQLIKQKKLLKKNIFLNADISQGYGSKLLTGERVTRNRDLILRICYAAEFTLDETQRALKLYPFDTLYVRNKREALIMACFNNRPGDIFDLNELLESNGMEPLRKMESEMK